jgi:hypothetical protein
MSLAELHAFIISVNVSFAQVGNAIHPRLNPFRIENNKRRNFFFWNYYKNEDLYRGSGFPAAIATAA